MVMHGDAEVLTIITLPFWNGVIFLGLIRNPILDIYQLNSIVTWLHNAMLTHAQKTVRHTAERNMEVWMRRLETWPYYGQDRDRECSIFHFFFKQTVIVYSLKHIQYLRWMVKEIIYTEWWSRQDCKLLCSAGSDLHPGTERMRQTFFFSKTRQKWTLMHFA